MTNNLSEKSTLCVTGQRLGAVHEFVDFLRTFSREYDFVLAFLQTCEHLRVNFRYGDQLPEVWTILNDFLERDYRNKELVITKVSYNSPFEIHFEGISGAIEKLSDLHERRRDDRDFGREERKRKAKLENDLIEAEVNSKKLENAEKVLEYTKKNVDFLKELGYTPEQIETAVRSKMGIQDIIDTSRFQQDGYIDNMTLLGNDD
ncbi:hypothetical protein FACS1894217_05370 [Clostridia bacterium]|nr:hypothetical protein FACS1894217_05370 [Clostridia bacterium]